jgi:hypothetical protein
MNKKITLKDIDRTGIRDVSLQALDEAAKRNSTIKLVGSIEGDKATVKPIEIAKNNPLCVSGVLNAVTFSTEYAGEQTLIGRGAGGDVKKRIDLASESALVQTLEKHHASCTLISEESGVKTIGDNPCEFYVTADPIDGTANAVRGLPFVVESKAALIGLIVCVVILLVAVFAPWVAPQDPYNLATLNILDSRLPPGSKGFSGGSVLAGDRRTGTRHDLRHDLRPAHQPRCGLLSGVFAIVVGTTLGLLAAYRADGWMPSSCDGLI